MKHPVVYSKTIVVDESVIDHFNHVNNLAYVRWALEISKEHWNSFTSEDIQNTYGWMILKHELTYKKQAKLGDELLIKTHIHENSTATSVRKTEILFKHNNKIIFESLAQWCFVKLDTQKPTRIKDNILTPFYKEQ
jgi:acyl-CoA thioester hydrolase